MSDSAISGFHLQQSLGRGSCGETFISLDEQGQEWVFKNFSSLSIDRKLADQSYRRLARAVAAGRPHPGLVSVVDYQFEQSPYYCVMERIAPIDGNGAHPVSLAQLGQVDELEAWQMIYDLAEATGELHKHGVIHGNLHPGNIFLSKDPKSKIKVTDFGTGLMGEVHHIDLGENTYFCPPDQIANYLHPGDGNAERWDVYRFGAIAYFLINGHHARGEKYFKELEHNIATSGGRPVGVDAERFAELVRENPDFKWNKSTRRREFQLRRDIINRCLSLDPLDRLTDMREVRNEFRRLETQFALENAEVRVIREREKQATRLFITRSIAVGLAASLTIATVYLVQYLNRHSEAQVRVSELNSMVDYQDKELVNSERRWMQSQNDLKTSREAASTFFAKMAVHAGGNGVPLDADAGEGSLNQLIDAQSYFKKTIEDIDPTDPNATLERARADHALGHISLRLEENEEAIRLFTQAAAEMEEVLIEKSDNRGVVMDLNERLMDSYVTLAELHQPGPNELVLSNLRKAADYVLAVREQRPNDESLRSREAEIGLQLGQELHLHREFEDAINAFARAGEIATEMQAESTNDKQLAELISRLQYSIAIPLREAGRIEESINAHLASIETLAILEQDYGLSELQKIRLADSHTEFGEMIADTASLDEQKGLHNEAIRLLTPLLEDHPELVPGIICLSRNYAHVGALEAKAKRWSDGYKLSNQAISQMEAVIEQLPDDIVCQLTLAELRGQHADMLQYQHAAARACMEKGLTSAEIVSKIVSESQSITPPMKRTYSMRLAKIYDTYGKLSKAIGDTTKAESLFLKSAASLEIALQDRQPTASWMKERLEAKAASEQVSR